MNNYYYLAESGYLDLSYIKFYCRINVPKLVLNNALDLMNLFITSLLTLIVFSHRFMNIFSGQITHYHPKGLCIYTTYHFQPDSKYPGFLVCICMCNLVYTEHRRTHRKCRLDDDLRIHVLVLQYIRCT